MDQELRLPASVIRKIIKERLEEMGSNAKVQGSGQKAVIMAATVFLNYVSGIAFEIVKERKSVQLTAKDVIAALKDVDFDDIAAAVQEKETSSNKKDVTMNDTEPVDEQEEDKEASAIEHDELEEVNEKGGYRESAKKSGESSSKDDETEAPATAPEAHLVDDTIDPEEDQAEDTIAPEEDQVEDTSQNPDENVSSGRRLNYIPAQNTSEIVPIID